MCHLGTYLWLQQLILEEVQQRATTEWTVVCSALIGECKHSCTFFAQFSATCRKHRDMSDLIDWDSRCFPYQLHEFLHESHRDASLFIILLLCVHFLLWVAPNFA